MTDVLAFLIAIPLAIELIAAAYGPLDLARYPRLAARALVRLLVMLSVVAALVWWLGAPLAAGICAYAALFVLKHFANGWMFRRSVEHKRPVWTTMEARTLNASQREDRRTKQGTDHHGFGKNG